MKLGSKPIVCLKQSFNLQSCDACAMTKTCGRSQAPTFTWSDLIALRSLLWPKNVTPLFPLFWLNSHCSTISAFRMLTSLVIFIRWQLQKNCYFWQSYIGQSSARMNNVRKKIGAKLPHQSNKVVLGKRGSNQRSTHHEQHSPHYPVDLFPVNVCTCCSCLFQLLFDQCETWFLYVPVQNSDIEQWHN